MRIAVSSSTFRRPLADGSLSQLEWLERCAELDADGAVAAVADFPRTDDEYVAQIRKVATDLALVPVGLEAPRLLDPAGSAQDREMLFALARDLGALWIRCALPAPGEVPPATFVETVRTAKAAAKAAKAINVTLVVGPQPGTLAEDRDAVRHLVRDVDSAWLRAAADPLEAEPARAPLAIVGPGADPHRVAAGLGRGWLLVDAYEASIGAAIAALRLADAQRRIGGG